MGTLQPTDRKAIARAILDAFHRTHGGRSTDDVIIDDELNAQFLASCAEVLPQFSAAEINWRLMGLRKAGKIGRVTTIRVSLKDWDEYLPAAEIAARCLEDKHGLTVDRIFCDPAHRRDFDQIAQSIAPGFSAYLYRKAALSLRKNRRLRPELMKRLGAFKADVRMKDASAYEADAELLPMSPGAYAFLDDTGYLYIGEADDLRSRLKKHLFHSDRPGLARYLWEHGTGRIKLELFVFGEGSEGANRSSRRAFEAALIASRAPRFNVQCV